MKRLGVTELLFTSDGQGSVTKSLKLRPAEEVLMTINLMTDNGGIEDLKRLQVRGHVNTIMLSCDHHMQPDKPVMIMEFWSGWFDHWNEPHLTRNQMPTEIATKTSMILKEGGSVNYYMFHGEYCHAPSIATPLMCHTPPPGGTNFGFMNGANWGYQGISFLPTITSYGQCMYSMPGSHMTVT